MQQEQIKSIVASNLWDYLVEVEKSIHEGYTLSALNENFPQGYVGMYTVTLVKKVKEIADTTPVKEVTIADVVSNQEKKTAGRKPKVSN